MLQSQHLVGRARRITISRTAQATQCDSDLLPTKAKNFKVWGAVLKFLRRVFTVTLRATSACYFPGTCEILLRCG